VLLALAVVGRPLLFASVDPAVAAARGVPVRLLSTVFLVVLGAATAATSQITGALLVFALLVMPAATAQNLTARPARGLAVSVLIALGVTWTSLTVAYYSPYPIGFWVTTFAFAAYAASWGARVLSERAGRTTGRTGALNSSDGADGADRADGADPSDGPDGADRPGRGRGRGRRQGGSGRPPAPAADASTWTSGSLL
jgi:zinc/manganese transport system permease protein